MKLSVVIPCYRSEETLRAVVEETIDVILRRQEYEYEIILVNDHSPDGVWRVICALAQENKKIKGVNLARNFGQHAALLAGYSYCDGDYVVSLDDDGQTPVDALYDLVDKLEEGYDAVYANYPQVQQSLFRRFGSWVAWKMESVMLNRPKDFKGSSFYVAKRFVIQEMLKYKNPYPYLVGLVLRATHSVACVPTKHRKRTDGTSGYSMRKLFSLWVNGFTAFSVKPLEISIYTGVISAVIGFVYAIVTIIRKLCGASIIMGWSSLISVILILGGITLINLGIIGEYIGRMYICMNSAPQYVVSEVVNVEEERL